MEKPIENIDVLRYYLWMELKTKNSPFSVSEYVIPEIKKLQDYSEKAIEDFKHSITLQTQGGPVLLSEETPLIESIISFATSYGISQEVVLRLKSGQNILLFKHSIGNLLRPFEADESIWNEIGNKTIFEIKSISNETISLDLPLLWNQSKGDELISKTKNFAKTISGFMTKAESIALVGEIPILPLLVAIYLVRPHGRVVDFIDSASNKINLFQ